MSRVGQGIDVHPFDESRPLILGGVTIAERGGLAGHSDADAVLHALTDALLGAAGAGDIGEYFPSDDPQWKGADSARFVREAMRVLSEQELEIENVDLTIIAQRPKIAPHRQAIRRAVAGLLGMVEGAVNVKATTTDGLGFIGRAEGIAAMAIVSVSRSTPAGGFDGR